MYVDKVPSGYRVIARGEVLHLRPAEAEKLVTSLLSEMPNIPDRIKLVWSLQIDPRGKLVRTFKYTENGLQEYFHLEVYILSGKDHSLYRGPESPIPLDAILQGFEGYGEDIEIVEVATDLVSKKIAEKEMSRAKVAATVQQKYGMTMKEIIRYVNKHKELPAEQVGS